MSSVMRAFKMNCLTLGQIGLIAILSINGCSRSQSSYDQHFDRPLPKGSKMLHYHYQHAGFSDKSYAFVFAVSDEALRDRLIKEWNLKPVGQATSFVRRNAPSWWPSYEDRSQMAECYGWDDEDNEGYWSIWIDRDRRLLYAEYGNW
jgi:hypothetical protein